MRIVLIYSCGFFFFFGGSTVIGVGSGELEYMLTHDNLGRDHLC